MTLIMIKGNDNHGLVMARALKIFFLIVFAFNWVPQGGAVVRYPTLEKMLERVDREYPPEIAKEIRGHSSPLAMCGVKAVIESNRNSLLGISHLASIVASPLTPLDVFALVPKNNAVVLRSHQQPSSLSVPHAVLLPPPRLSI
jgi:O-succinylbenzoate synthase